MVTATVAAMRSQHFCLLVLIAVLLAATSLNASDLKAHQHNAMRSKRALDQVGSWLLKRFPAGERHTPASVAQGPPLKGSPKADNEPNVNKLDHEEEKDVEKRYLDSVGSYLLRKRIRPNKSIRAIDQIGSYLI